MVLYIPTLSIACNPGSPTVAPRRSAHGGWWFAPLFCFLFVVSGIAEAASVRSTPPDPLAEPLTATIPDWDKVRTAVPALVTGPPTGTDPLVYFIDPLGREMGVSDAASTLAATKLPPALATELKVATLAETARRLIRSLAAWNVATAVQQMAQATTQADVASVSRQIMNQAAWLRDGEEIPLLNDILRSMTGLSSEDPNSPPAPQDYEALLNREGATSQGQTDSRAVASHLRPLVRLRLAQLGSQLEAWAIQRASRDWFSIVQWKDSVRLRRGLVRLCGSWQWTIHNHQHHGEQKLTVSFPSADGPVEAGSATAGPAEIVVLGDAVYLRWENGGRVQEDSLLLSKENQRLEGTFVNNMGGWGSVTGKRTAACSKKPTASSSEVSK